MSYLVMETNRAFAVVLDGEGRFSKVVNLNYETGETVSTVVPLCSPTVEKARSQRPAIITALALCACMMLAVFSVYKANFVSHGTVRISINPDVLLSVSKTQRVLEIDALNEDGAILVSGYDYRGKNRDAVTAELVKRSADMGYLKEGGEVRITLSSEDEEWRAQTESGIAQELEKDFQTQDVTIYMGTADASVPDLVIETAAEAEKWLTWDDYDEFSSYRLREFGGQLQQWGLEAAPDLEDWGEGIGQAAEDWGESIGRAAEDWGESIGQAAEDWGETKGEEFAKKFGSSDYWKGFLQNGVSQNDIDSLIGDIFGILG